MTKKGNRYLKKTIYMCVLAQVLPHAPDNPIKHHYWRKVAQGTEKVVAIGSCTGKLVGLVYGILTSGGPFDPDYGFGDGNFDVRFVDRNTGCVVPEEEAVSSDYVVAIRWNRATAPRSDSHRKRSCGLLDISVYLFFLVVSLRWMGKEVQQMKLH